MNENEAADLLADIGDAMQLVWNKYGWARGSLGQQSIGYCAMGCWYYATGQKDQRGGPVRSGV